MLSTLVVPGWMLATAQELAVSDLSVADAVEDELANDAFVTAAGIRVLAADGIVTLNGTAESLLAKERAAAVAALVKGVRAVVNGLAVRPSVRLSDDVLRQGIIAALTANPVTERKDIDVSVASGRVTLSGHVDSRQELDVAGRVAKGAIGVTQLENLLEFDVSDARTDSDIEADIVSALRWDALVDDALIKVEVEDGTASLLGTVGSAFERARAVSDAWVAGVRAVDSEGLLVARWARDSDLRGDKLAPKADADISDAVQDALANDPRVSLGDVQVLVSEGVVTLRGKVANLEAKHAAAQDARNTVGVVSVNNGIEIHQADPAENPEIAEAARAALIRDPYTNPYDISVRVVDGVAHLTGTVDLFAQKAQAENVVAGVPSVQSVVNDVDVSRSHQPLKFNSRLDPVPPESYEWYEFAPGSPTDDDATIARNIEEQLWWSPFIDLEDVTVTVTDGVATLTGVVDSLDERRAAAENALDGGAARVINRLTISAPPSLSRG